MNSICTIITGTYGHYALALHDSILKFSSDINFSIFITEGSLDKDIQKEINKRNNIFIYTEKDLEHIDIAVQLNQKYKDAYHDAYRWGMKPVFLNYLLEKDIEKVIYVDSDIYFFNDFSFLFAKLDTCKLLLSPHWRSSDPVLDLSNFKLNFIDGIFNGGFIGASKGSNAVLKYWAELCLFKCEVKRNEGFYVDQKYLDILPTRFNGVCHITHKGCNIANWNQVDCKRTLDDSGEVLINKEYPIVFIHFTNSFFRGVLLKNDRLLLKHLEEYRDVLLKYSKKDVIEYFLAKKRFEKPRSEETSKNKLKNKKLLVRIKNRIKKYIKF